MSAIAIVLLAMQVPADQLMDALARAQILPALLVAVGTGWSVVARALRWGVYFRPERRVAFGPLLGTLSIGYMASTFLPFRAGEVVRAVFFGQRERIAVPRIFGTILLEKLFDFLAIGVMLVGLLLTTPLPPAAVVAGGSVAGVMLGGFGFIVALAVWRAPTLRLVDAVEGLIPLGLGRRVGLTRAVEQFAEGTDSLRVAPLWLPMLGWTAAAWAGTYVAAWGSGVALGLPLSVAAITFLVVVTSTGQAVPSSPGYVGVFHAAAVLALTTFGVGQAEALAIAVLLHAITYGFLVVAGLAALWLGGYGLRDLRVGLQGRSAATSA